MKGSDKAVVFGVVMAIILAGFYFKVVSPKREKASSLGKDVTALEAQVSQQKQDAQLGEAARQDFPAYYGRLVVLGKAVPGQADTPSLIVQLNTLAERTHVDFQGIALSNDSGSSSASAPAPTPTPPSGTAPSTGTTSTTSTTPSTGTPPSTTGSPTSSTASSTSPAPATEAGAANLPLGATVGEAGLSTMPYDLTFAGNYFDVADFLKGVDDLVHLQENGQVSSDGRLLTVNGFLLKPSPKQIPGDPNMRLLVTLSVTSYVTPAAADLSGAASPSGSASSPGQTPLQPTSQPVSP